tara:strand:+ start:14 stop:919 length:906 start_codon:yes stop_codon:yes gene_type:complete
MTLNFPASPNVGQTYSGTNGITYTYDGVKWTTQGTYASLTAEPKKIDDISSHFNGTTTTFNLHSSGSDIDVSSPLDLIISIGGVIQEPVVSYGINTANSEILFGEAPNKGDTFFGILKSKIADQNTTVTDGTINDAKLSGPIAVNKLAYGTTRQLLQTNSGPSAAEWTSNVDVPGSLAVTNGTTLNSTLAVAGKATLTAGAVFSKVSTTLPNADTFTVTGGWHELTSYSGTSDTILGAAGGTAGQILILTAVASHTITLTDGTDANDFMLGGDIILVGSNGDTVTLMFNGTNWLKIAHGDN